MNALSLLAKITANRIDKIAGISDEDFELGIDAAVDAYKKGAANREAINIGFNTAKQSHLARSDFEAGTPKSNDPVYLNAYGKLYEKSETLSWRGR